MAFSGISVSGVPVFADRREAGRRLAERLQSLGLSDPLVLALPRGGVPVASEVARALEAPLDVLLVRKLRAPGRPELALGAIVDGRPPQRFLNEALVSRLAVPQAWLRQEARHQYAVISERRRRWRPEHPAEPLAGRTVIVVDDGIATGATARAALMALAPARSGAARTVLAVPVAPADARERLPVRAEDLVCLAQPTPFEAVGCAYEDFDQTPDEEVVRLLAEARARRGVTARAS